MTGRAGALGAVLLEAGAGLFDPTAGGDTGRGTLGEGEDDVATDFGPGRACVVVQPASTSVRLVIVSAALLVVIRQRVLAAAADITSPLSLPHMTNA